MKFIAFVLFVIVVALVVRFRKEIWKDLKKAWKWIVSVFKKKK